MLHRCVHLAKVRTGGLRAVGCERKYSGVDQEEHALLLAHSRGPSGLGRFCGCSSGSSRGTPEGHKASVVSY